MTSTVTNYSDSIDTAFPVAGVSNDTQGFRTNFSAIKNALYVTSNEINNLQLELDTLQNTSLTYKDGAIQGSNLTLTGNLTASNVYAAGTIGTSSTVFVGDGSQLTNLPSPNLKDLTFLSLPSGTVSAQSVEASGGITGQYFVGDGSQLTNIKVGLATAVGVLNTLTVVGYAAITSIRSTGTIYANSLTVSGVLSVDNISASGITAGTVQASTFIGNGSQLTNLTIPKTLSLETLIISKPTDSSTATITVSNNSINIVNVERINVLSTATITATLTNWYGDSGTISTDKQFAFTFPNNGSISSVGVGTNAFNNFRLWSGDTLHTVTGATANGNVLTVTTDPTDITSASEAGVKIGSTVTFYRSLAPVVSLYTTVAPSTSKGTAGDKKGMVFATGAFTYICYADYTTGSADIWAKVSTVGQTW